MPSLTAPEVLSAAGALQKRAVALSALAATPGKTINASGMKAEVCEFLKHYSGPRSEFYLQAKEQRPSQQVELRALVAILASFISYAKAGLAERVSPERKGQLDVVSDLLAQAHQLLGSKGVHPAAPAMLIGATLEEFLRTWVEAVPLSLGNRKPGLHAYVDTLRDADLITKQDVKDLTAWAGMRNHAAHGEWNEVSDPARVRLMLEGINLFMRQHSV